jgi:WD40 repeat protein
LSATPCFLCHDNQIIASSSKDGSIKLWNLKGKLLRTLNEHSAEVRSVCFSPDGNTFTSGGSDNLVKIWSLEGKELLTLQGHQSPVKRVCFRPNGTTLGSGSVKGKIILRGFDLNNLIKLGNNWIQDYLETHVID